VGTPLLTIRGVRSTPVNVPMARPLKTSAQTINLAPLLLIDLETDEGVTGRSYLFCYTKMAPALIATVLSDALEVVHGDRVAPVDISAKLAEHYRLIGAQGVVRMARPIRASVCLKSSIPDELQLLAMSLFSRQLSGKAHQRQVCYSATPSSPLRHLRRGVGFDARVPPWKREISC
jgi:hypothetical protein